MGGMCRRLVGVRRPCHSGVHVVSIDGIELWAFPSAAEALRSDLGPRPWLEDVFAYESGDSLIVNPGFVGESWPERPFSVSPALGFSESDLLSALEAPSDVVPGLDRACLKFSTAFMLNLAGGRMYTACDMDAACSLASDEPFAPWVCGLADRLCGMTFSTELSRCVDGRRLLELLDSGYALMVSVEAGDVIGGVSLPESHALCLVPLSDGRIVLVDHRGAHVIGANGVMALSQVDHDRRLGTRKCYHGSMAIGFRREASLSTTHHL